MTTSAHSVLLVTQVLGLLIVALMTVDPDPSGVLAEESGPARQIIKAHAFHLVDDQDEIRATLALSDHRLVFTLLDGRGHVRAQVLMMATDQPGMILSGPDGVARLHLALLPDSTPPVILSDDQRQSRSALLLFSGGRPSLSVMNDKGQMLGQLWVKPDTTISLDADKPSCEEPGQGKQ
ncbi:MAG: hypothetical protein ABI856_09740 [Nitrospira sp.]